MTSWRRCAKLKRTSKRTSRSISISKRSCWKPCRRLQRPTRRRIPTRNDVTVNLEPKDLIASGIALLALWQSWRAGQIAKQEALRKEVSDNAAKINLLWQIVQGQLALNLKH